MKIPYTEFPAPKFAIGDVVVHQHAKHTFDRVPMTITQMATDGKNWIYLCSWTANGQGHRFDFQELVLELAESKAEYEE